ncbi:MAG: ABC transporter permease, partial [Hyphomicrobiales bacterium]
MVIEPQTDLLSTTDDAPAGARQEPGLMSILVLNPSIIIGGLLLAAIGLITVAGPFFTLDPVALNPINRLKVPGADGLFGTDYLGRDVFARVIHGSRISLVVGLAVSVFAVSIGLVIGLVSGYVRILDAVVMRIMDGLMAIP